MFGRDAAARAAHAGAALSACRKRLRLTMLFPLGPALVHDRDEIIHPERIWSEASIRVRRQALSWKYRIDEPCRAVGRNYRRCVLTDESIRRQTHAVALEIAVVGEHEMLRKPATRGKHRTPFLRADLVLIGKAVPLMQGHLRIAVKARG